MLLEGAQQEERGEGSWCLARLGGQAFYCDGGGQQWCEWGSHAWARTNPFSHHLELRQWHSRRSRARKQ